MAPDRQTDGLKDGQTEGRIGTKLYPSAFSEGLKHDVTIIRIPSL